MVFLSCEQRVRGGGELKGALAGNLLVPGHWEGRERRAAAAF